MTTSTLRELLQKIQESPWMAQPQRWVGALNPDRFTPDEVAQRNAFSDALERGDWVKALEVLLPNIEPRSTSQWVNLPRLNKGMESTKVSNGYCALHYAAAHGAPVEVVKMFVQLGAFRTYKATDGRLPIDIAHARGHAHLFAILKPVIVNLVILPNNLAKIESHFNHALQEEISQFIKSDELLLPQLSIVQELMYPELECPVIAYMGGYNVILKRDHIIVCFSGRMRQGGPTLKIAPDGVTVLQKSLSRVNGAFGE